MYYVVSIVNKTRTSSRCDLIGLRHLIINLKTILFGQIFRDTWSHLFLTWLVVLDALDPMVGQPTKVIITYKEQ